MSCEGREDRRPPGLSAYTLVEVRRFYFHSLFTPDTQLLNFFLGELYGLGYGFFAFWGEDFSLSVDELIFGHVIGLTKFGEPAGLSVSG